MTPDRWQLINNLFEAVVALQPERRAAFLDEACSTDEMLRSEVETLLASDESGWELLEQPALEVAAPLLADEQPQLLPGQRLSHYEIIKLIGRGGMGEVYLAKDEKLNRRIAIKLLPVDYTRNKDRLRRFEQEAQAASALNHPNILTIYEIREIGDQQFIATEFVEGETLRERMKRGGATLADALEIALQVAGALAAAHDAGIVHRDIKPENIMLRPDGYVKVVDFGLAKLTEQPDRTIEARAADNVDVSSGLVMGTVKYMSPEQACGLPIDPRSDIFSFGVVLYEMLTGRTPFNGEGTNDLIKSIVTQEAPSITKFLLDAPADLQPIVSKALNKDKAKRYQSAQEVLVDLKALSQRLENSLREKTLSRIADGHNLSVDRKRTTRILSVESVVSHLKQRRTGFALGLVVLLVGFIGIAVYSSRTLFDERGLSFEKAEVTKVSINGNVSGSAAISPDGKLIAYSVDESGQSSLWLTLADGTRTPKQLLSAGDADISGLVFSSDGQSLFFNEQKDRASVLYRTGIWASSPPIAVVEHVDSRVTLSPDDKQLSFIREYPNEGESVLIVMNVDGTEERRIATRKQPAYFAFNPAWSPDGKSIVAIIEGGSVNASSLIAFEVNGGAETKINTLTAWLRFRDVAWLPDGSGLILIVTEGGPTTTTEIWQLSYPEWQPIRITDSEKFYENLSLSKFSGTLLAVERQTASDIWISSLRESAEPTQATNNLLSGRGGVCWTPDDKIVYHSREQGNDFLRLMDVDGNNQQNLTSDSHGNFYPSVTADGRNIVFMSRRTGALHIWRLDTQTGQQIQLTGGCDEQFPHVSADGKRVYYVSWESGAGAVWQVSTNGGQPSQVISESSYYPELSPDGKLLTYIAFENRTTLRKVVSLEGAQTSYTFKGPLARLRQAHWSRTGNALLYLEQRDGAWNVWRQPLAGGQPIQLTHFNEGRIYFFDESWDGKDLVLSRGSESRAIVLFKGSS